MNLLLAKSWLLLAKNARGAQHHLGGYFLFEDTLRALNPANLLLPNARILVGNVCISTVCMKGERSEARQKVRMSNEFISVCVCVCRSDERQKSMRVRLVWTGGGGFVGAFREGDDG